MPYPVVSCPNCKAEILLNRARSKNSWYRCKSCKQNYGSYQLYNLSIQQYDEKIGAIDKKLEEIRQNDPSRVDYKQFKRRAKKVDPLAGEELLQEKKKTKKESWGFADDEDPEEILKDWIS